MSAQEEVKNLLGVLLDIKRIVGHRDDRDKDQHALLELVAVRVQQAIDGKGARVPRVVVTTDGGQIQQVVKDSPVEVLVVDYCVGDADESDTRVRRVDGELAEMVLFDADEDVNPEDTAKLFAVLEGSDEDLEELAVSAQAMNDFVQALCAATSMPKPKVLKVAFALRDLAEKHRFLCVMDANSGLDRAQENALEAIEDRISEAALVLPGVMRVDFRRVPPASTVGLFLATRDSNSQTGAWKIPCDAAKFAALEGKPFWKEFVPKSKARGMTP